MNDLKISQLSFLGALFTLVVISLGAWVRLTDAGLGCPDWPGCYGLLTTPDTADELAKAKEYYPDAQIDVKDMGGGDHLEVNVVSEEFSGLSLVQQHQLVYGALKNELKTETIHALALKTSTPQ